MREFKASQLSAAEKIFQAKARDAVIKEKQCNLAIRRKLVNFYIWKEIACFIFLIAMLILVLMGVVNTGIFFVSQIINGIIRGRGKGLQRITESEFPVRD